MRTICFAAVAATMLAACAANGSGNGNDGARPPAAAAAAAGKQYCSESRLASAGGRHNCNWTADKRVACEGDAPFSTLDASRYTAPRTSSQCSSGRWVVEMSPMG